MSKLTTKSYFVKRLRDCGYQVDKVESIEYQESDQRKWTALIDAGGMSIFATCFKDDSLHLYDGGQYLNSNLKLSTDSIDVLIDFLNTQGLIHKHYLYGKPRRETPQTNN